MYRQESLEKAFFQRRAKTAHTDAKGRPFSGPSSADHASRLGQLRDRLAKSRTSSLRNFSRDGYYDTGSGIYRFRPGSSWTEDGSGGSSLPGIDSRLSPRASARRMVARQRFVHAVKMVVILRRVASVALEKRVEPSPPSRQEMTFTDMAEEVQSETMRSAGLSFDIRDYKATRELDISQEVKAILSSPTAYRTEEQIQTAVYGLQSMTSFAEYPLHMQEKLVRVAWYERVPPKTVIIRQGHSAENFYFVLSGSVTVSIMEEDPATGGHRARTAAILRKGNSFGELALLHHSTRAATVSSQGPVQVLAIGREDFFDIFMRPQNSGSEPPHLAFVRHLPFMRHWPMDVLLQHPEMCLFHFYKRGQLVVRDSNNSDWIYVVKSGSCRVIRRLASVKPNVHRKKRKQKPTIHYHADIHNWQRERRNQHCSSNERTPLITSSISEEVDCLSHSEMCFLTDESPMINRTKRITLPDIFTAHPVRSRDSDDGHTFVQVELLEPRGVFGLSTLNIDPGPSHGQPSVSLVSLGAELVMIHKGCFLRYADQRVRRNLLPLIQMYPSTETLQRNLQNHADWIHYKEEVVDDLLAGRLGPEDYKLLQKLKRDPPIRNTRHHISRLPVNG